MITGGPTNEKIDEVMKITNMSSGKLAVNLALELCKDNHVTLLLTKGVPVPETADNLTVIRIESTDDLLENIKLEAVKEQYDVIVHSAAVADYKPEFSFKMEDMAEEILRNLFLEFQNPEEIPEGILVQNILQTLTNPDCKVNSETKISSMEQNLTVKLRLTPKIISSLRTLFPKSKIFAFKLLENVSEEALYEAATKIAKKNSVDYVFANDLQKLRSGNRTRHVVTANGYTNTDIQTVKEMADFIRNS